MAKTDEEKEAEARAKAQAEAEEATADREQESKDQLARDAQAIADRPEGGAVTGSTDKDEQIAHGKAPIQPGPEKPVDPEDAAAAKVNRGQGLGG